jgi:hypothetical protein
MNGLLEEKINGTDLNARWARNMLVRATVQRALQRQPPAAP